MADEATTQESTDSSAEQPAVDSQSSEQTTQSDADSQSQDQSTEQSQSSNPDSGKADPASTGDKSKSENQDSRPDSKPLSRRSAQYRIQQLVQENQELKKQQNPKQEQDDWEEEGASDDPKPKQPDISELIAKEVERRLNPVMSEHSKAADDGEINELFSGDKAADKTKYEGKIREMWKIPFYKDVGAADLYKIAKFDELQASIPAIQQQAVEDYKKAEKEARDSSASGNSNNSNRTGKGGGSINDMTDEEFRQHNERVKAGLA